MFQRTAVRGRHVRDGGATAVEYALILGGVVLASALAIVGLKGVMATAFQGASNNQAILSDGSTATAPAPSATPTATPTTASPTPTATTPTSTPTSTTPTPTPSSTRISRTAPTWTSSAYNLPFDTGNSCTVVPGSGGVCAFSYGSRRTPDRITFDPNNSAPVNTVVTVTWTICLTQNFRGNCTSTQTVTETFVLT
jgi:Flp pilus assembly pilin Flp